MGGSSPRDSAPGKRPHGEQENGRKSAASCKPSAPKPASVLTAASDLNFGKVIGQGTQGTVRVAKHRTSGKRYVVKLLPLGYESAQPNPRDPLSMMDDDARRVMAEAELLKLASSHPNIVRFHGAFRRDVGREGPSNSKTSAELCIVMSHCEGGDLASLLRRCQLGGECLSEEQVMRWLVQLLLGLHHIHGKHILHRDIKPANVFLSRSHKVVRLGDFGIAKKLRDEDTLADTVVGTPLYMSPELCQGKPYTYASDVWALGCVAYEIATGGVKAFDAPGWPQLLVRIIRCDYAPVPSRFSRPFASLIGAMLSPDPHDRPTTEQLLTSPLVRKHCEALLKDAKESVGRVYGQDVGLHEKNNTPRMSSKGTETARGRKSRGGVKTNGGVSGVIDTSRRVSQGRESSFGMGASAAADAEKKAAAEARYAARQNALRRDRMAVRDADPKRAAARAIADQDNERRMARQEARARAEAEAALLKQRGFDEVPVRIESDKSDSERSKETVMKTVQENTNDTSATSYRAACAFQSRPLLQRTDAGTAKEASEAAEIETTCETVESEELDQSGESTTETLEFAEIKDAEEALLEALMAEARDDALEEEKVEAEIDAADESVASDTALEINNDETNIDASEDTSGTETRVDFDVESSVACLSASDASEKSALLGSRAVTAPGGARPFARPDEKNTSTSSSFEWPPSSFRSEKQTAKDAALERRVAAKLRSFLKGHEGCGGRYVGRPSTAVGTRGGGEEDVSNKPSAVKQENVEEVNSGSDSEASLMNSDDFESSLSADFEDLFKGD